jgi:hypothetical protein
MKQLSTLLVAIVFSGTIGISPVFADPSTPTPMSSQNPVTPSTDKQAYNSMLQESSVMMGHVAAANIALLYILPDEAAENVQKALTIANKLEVQTVQLNADFSKFGKLKYRNAAGEMHDYWLPIVNDTFVVGNLDSEYLKSKQLVEAEEDAQLVTTEVILDVKQVRDSLETAATALSTKNYTGAEIALLNAETSTFTGNIIRELPLVSARDNLMLAQNLSKSKDYEGASFALNHAKDAMTEFEKTASKEKTIEVDKLKTEISALQAEIVKDKTSVITNIEKRISAWVQKVDSLI